MKLTKKERILLINQYKILAALHPNESSRYNELVEILENGFKVFYSMVDEWISDEMSEIEGNLVLEILDFYKLLEEYKERNPEIKEVCDHKLSTFMGFDGNNETEHMFFTRFLINTQGKFSEQEQYAMKTDNYNSYVPMLGIYKKIINKWNETGKEYEPTKERLLEILNT